MKIESLIHCGTSIAQMPFEIVEIKGRGHPDTICDLICEHVSKDLLNFYTQECGQFLHYNVDKALLVGGRARPKFSGGEVIEPAKLYLGDRATDTFNERKLPLTEVVQASVDDWLKGNLRYLRLGSNLTFHNEIKPGSQSLSSVESRRVSNDTSVGVGSWPPTELEKIVVDLEDRLNSEEFKTNFPETGEDIKIMATRIERDVKVICAIAMIDRFIESVSEYEEKKSVLINEIEKYLSSRFGKFNFSVHVNCLDDPAQLEGGLHLTVTGLSCENGDSGQVGRGNRVNNVISFLRPQTMEAWAGKNPISHIGKIYSFAAQTLARKICEVLPYVGQANVFLVGQIGAPVNRPAYIYTDLAVPKGCEQHFSKEEVSQIIIAEIERSEIFQIPNVMSRKESSNLQRRK